MLEVILKYEFIEVSRKTDVMIGTSEPRAGLRTTLAPVNAGRTWTRLGRFVATADFASRRFLFVRLNNQLKRNAAHADIARWLAF